MAQAATRPDYTTAAAGGTTEALANHVVGTSYLDLPQEAVDTVKKVVLDGVGVTVAGSQEQAVRRLQAYARTMREGPVSSVVGAGFRTSATSAAFVNGGACHVLDYEVMWNTHPTSTLLPGILALAEWKTLSGRDIIAAMAVGLEVTGRLRQAGTDTTRVPLHFPGLVGAVASAAACSRLLGLDAMKTRMAIGMGGSRVGGVFANVGTDTKCQHCGHASRMGVESALLAQLGATANPSSIEWYQGYADVYYTREFDLNILTRSFGNPWRFLEDPPNIKRYPANTAMHCGIEAVKEIRRKHDIDPSQVEELVIEGPVWQYVNRPQPQTGLDGKFSYQYSTAVALLDGDVTIESFHDERFSRPDAQEMLRKVRLVENNTPLAGHEGKGMFREAQWKEVTVRMKDGAAYSARADIPPGFVGGRPLSPEEHRAKLDDCFGRYLSPARTDWCIGLLNGLEDASGGDIVELMSVLRG